MFDQLAGLRKVAAYFLMQKCENGRMPEPLKVLAFDVAFVKAVSNVLGQTEHPGLSNAEIDQLLRQVNVTSRPEGNKRNSLFEALWERQNRQAAGNVVAGFVARSMHPSRYVSNPGRFTDLRDQLNEAIVYFGWSVTEEGRLARGTRASTLTEGARLSGRLLTELTRRGLHRELTRYCAEEFVTRSLFHAISEASKSIPSRVREMTGLAGDGDALYNGVFGTGGGVQPVLMINSYSSDSDVSEHKGFKNLLLGVHGHYRNPRAHGNRIDSHENMEDFFDAFSLFSYIHRRLDRATIRR